MKQPARMVKTIFLKATRDQVWSFLAEKDKLAQWFHESRVDLEDQQEYELLSNDPNEKDQKVCGGRVLHMQAPEKLVYTFTHDWLKGVETTVTWDLSESFGGTMLTLTHEGFEHAPVDVFESLYDHDKGWDEHFGRLRDKLYHSDA